MCIMALSVCLLLFANFSVMHASVEECEMKLDRPKPQNKRLTKTYGGADLSDAGESESCWVMTAGFIGLGETGQVLPNHSKPSPLRYLLGHTDTHTRRGKHKAGSAMGGRNTVTL